ncbi:1,4-alpha-glucan branching protein [Streptomyces sp. NPDC020875]|uniref:maltokinase N-terminal cap-like domain-containing protein n=1 Tax=Streptomyces sp. NPDC020875 TaxID=3154898 RepID=UPI0033DDEA72
MAVVHHTTLRPTKPELLARWLPTRPWYRGGPAPEPTTVGGFRLDDPAGEVGIEFIVLTEESGPEPAVHLVPLTYRGAPLDGADDDAALVGTLEHGVLGKRWVYDGSHDPVLVSRLLALIEGRTEAQDQNTTGTPDRDVSREYSGTAAPLPGAADVLAPGTVTDDGEGTVVALGPDLALHLHRDPREPLPEGTIGHVEGSWRGADGSRERGVFATIRRGGAS